MVLGADVQQTANARDDPAAAVEVAARGKQAHLDARTGVRRLDEATAADVHADVAEAVEEDEVAGPQALARDPLAEVEVRVRAVREGDPEVRVDEPDEAGAVEARRRAAAPDVRDAEEAPSVGGRL